MTVSSIKRTSLEYFGVNDGSNIFCCKIFNNINFYGCNKFRGIISQSVFHSLIFERKALDYPSGGTYGTPLKG